MRFAYRPYPIDPSPADPSDVSFRPELLVRMSGARGRTNEITVWGLLDTGSIDCILPFSVADQLKPTWLGKGAIADYARGSHAVQSGGVYLQVQLEKRRVRWPAIVAVSHKEMTIPLWGRCGFLQYFNVTFNGPDKSFVIRLRGPVPGEFTVRPVPKPGRQSSKGSDLITPGEQNP
jgi:hypothetical protein